MLYGLRRVLRYGDDKVKEGGERREEKTGDSFFGNGAVRCGTEWCGRCGQDGQYGRYGRMRVCRWSSGWIGWERLRGYEGGGWEEVVVVVVVEEQKERKKKERSG